MIDEYGRTIDYLRISVTDRCSERCIYCMPPEGITRMSHADILNYGEILRLVRIMVPLGFHKFKLTGGEPLVRRDLSALLYEMKSIPGVASVTLTTNGLALADQIASLAAAGLDAVNISLDTLDPVLYKKITRTGNLQAVREGIESVLNYPEIVCKIDCVLLGMQGQKLTDVASYAKDRPVHVRFIEMMPIGMGREFLEREGEESSAAEELPSLCGTEPVYTGMTTDEAAAILENAFGPLTKTDVHLGNGPSEYYSLPSFAGKIGFIGAVTHKFCENCNRVRLTSSGFLKTCLRYSTGVDLKACLRSGASDGEIEEAIRRAILKKPKEHGFYSVHPDEPDMEETKNMNGIGG